MVATAIDSAAIESTVSAIYFHKEKIGYAACVDIDEASLCAIGGSKDSALDELQRNLNAAGYMVKLSYSK